MAYQWVNRGESGWIGVPRFVSFRLKSIQSMDKRNKKPVCANVSSKKIKKSWIQGTQRTRKTQRTHDKNKEKDKKIWIRKTMKRTKAPALVLGKVNPNFTSSLSIFPHLFVLPILATCCGDLSANTPSAQCKKRNEPRRLSFGECVRSVSIYCPQGKNLWLYYFSIFMTNVHVMLLFQRGQRYGFFLGVS